MMITFAVLAVPAGVIAVISVSLTTEKLVAAAPPMVTEVAPVKPLPVIVTDVPPVIGPVAGEMPVKIGVGGAAVVGIVVGTGVAVVVGTVVATVVIVVVVLSAATGITVTAIKISIRQPDREMKRAFTVHPLSFYRYYSTPR
jgi:hypothetical protein